MEAARTGAERALNAANARLARMLSRLVACTGHIDEAGVRRAGRRRGIFGRGVEVVHYRERRNARLRGQSLRRWIVALCEKQRSARYLSYQYMVCVDTF